VKHSEASDLSKCGGELKYRGKIIFCGEEYEEYRYQKCKKWIYLPTDKTTRFRFETRVRI
jgi:hypothetical protein